MQNIDILIQHIPIPLLKQSAANISARYRNQEKPYLKQKIDYLAYALTRMPATYAAICKVLKEIKQPDIHSFLDLGAGPGTAVFAMQQYFPQLSEITLLESDPEFISLAKKLISTEVVWQNDSLPCALIPHDLVLMSYSLNEMSNMQEIVLSAFHAAQKLLVIIEPGTPDGHQRIMAARTLLLENGAHMVAPCPNALPCPMQNNNWCHFPARVERSKLHKQLKGGDLGYEDEKFSYLIVSKESQSLPNARIIDKPEFHSGHVRFSLCTKGTIDTKILAKKEKEFYKKCRKLTWGDSM